MRFAFHRDVALGRFVPLDTPVHRLDPRTKLVVFAMLVLGLFRLALPGTLALTVALLAVIALARLPAASFWAALKALRWILAITFLFQLLWVGPRRLGGLEAGAWQGLLMALRLADMLLAATLLAATTEPIRLGDGVARLFRPLERLRIPVSDLSLVLTLALRFLPTVMEEAQRLVTAQRARGARFEGGPLARARRMLPLAVPLFAGCLHRADILALAMEARGFGSGRPRTQWEPLRLRPADVWTMGLCGLILAASILLAAGSG